jgi:hypothetical protein
MLSYIYRCPKCTALQPPDMTISLKVMNGQLGWMRCARCKEYSVLDDYRCEIRHETSTPLKTAVSDSGVSTS